MRRQVAKISGTSVVLAVVLGGCRVDAPDAEAYLVSSDGSSGSVLGSSGGSTGIGDDAATSSGGEASADASSGSGTSTGDDGPALTSGPETTTTTETSDGTSDGSSTGPSDACGDGNVDPGEVCDDGINDGSYGGCARGCMALGPYCGDGAVDGPEACDDGVNDGSYGGCVPGCLALAPYCGDAVIDLVEVCDDGINDGAYAGCTPGCMALAPYCGDGFVDGPEVCDDGINDGSYGGCGIECLSPPTYCGDGMVDGPEACDDGNADAHDGCLASCAVPTSCVGIKSFDAAAPDGVYLIDAGFGPFAVYCNMTLDGGGWQLVSVRYQDIGVLFADAVCTGLETDCSGTIPDAQLVPGDAPELLFATTDGTFWLRVTGLDPAGSALLEVIALDRVLEDTDSCTGDHYCGSSLDMGLVVGDSSPNYVPRFLSLPAQFARYGGIWLGNGGGGAFHHVVSLNYGDYCAPGSSGLQLSDASDLTLGNVTCSQPGALYFRY